MNPSSEQLSELVRLVRQNSKYALIDESLISTIGAAEITKRSSLREAVKSTRNKLHQVGSSYQEKTIPYDQWRQTLLDLPEDLHDDQVIEFLRTCMRMHTSTSERLIINEVFFKQTLELIGPVTSILDLACGLNPLNLPWMPVGRSFNYRACDIFSDMIDYLQFFFDHFGINGSAFNCDLIHTIPDDKVQLALLLKTIPCLEQVEKSAGKRLLDEIHAENILVSFPGHSLSGQSKGMVQNYETHFNELVAGKGWNIFKFEFPGELAFLIQK